LSGLAATVMTYQLLCPSRRVRLICLTQPRCAVASHIAVCRAKLAPPGTNDLSYRLCAALHVTIQRVLLDLYGVVYAHGLDALDVVIKLVQRLLAGDELERHLLAVGVDVGHDAIEFLGLVSGLSDHRHIPIVAVLLPG